MVDASSGGTLALTHEGKPGLPRGRSGLPTRTVRASHRKRLQSAVTAAVSELGYPAVSVGEIVKRARVSKAAFYAHFADKEDCFLDAMHEGGKLMADHVKSATRALPAGTSDEEILRVACHAFLAFLTGEPEFARVYYLDMQAVDPQAIEKRVGGARRFADLNGAWHERARIRHPEWPVVPDEAYLALAGASGELIRATLRDGKADELGNLEGTLVSLHLAVLAGRRWPG